MTSRLTTLILLFISSAGFAGGGSVVGNGAGLVEHNFQYAYTTLSSTVRNCLESNSCGMNSRETEILYAIQAVLETNVSKTDRLVFISEKESPGFFETGPNEKHRIAKTGLNPETSIFVNVDSLYLDNGKPALDYATIVSILAHELGHQAGETNHSLLDIIGAKLKKTLEEKMVRHSIEFGVPSRDIEVLIINHNLPMRTAEVVLTWEGLGSNKVTSSVVDSFQCSDPAANLSGFEIRNGHYFINESPDQNETSLGFSLWAYIYCYNGLDKRVVLEKSQIRFEILNNLKFRLIDSLRIP